MPDFSTTDVTYPTDLVVGLSTVVTVCVALMIWIGLLGRPSRATLLWTLALLLAMLGCNGSLASSALGIDFLPYRIGLGISCGSPLLIWSGLRAAQGKRPYAWLGFAQSIASVALMAITTDLATGLTAFRWLFLASAVGAAVGAVEVLRGAFRGSRFGIPLVVASGALLLLSAVGAVGVVSGASAETDLLFSRGVIITTMVYIICATVSLLFLANRRQGADDVLEAIDAFLPVSMMRAVVREKLVRAHARGEHNWSFIELRLDDATDLREATGEASFRSMVHWFETTVAEALPAEADLCRVTPGQVVAFSSQPSAAVRDSVRAVLNAIATPRTDAPTSFLISASAGIVTVDTAADSYESLAAAAGDAADTAQREGGDRWSRVGTDGAPENRGGR